MELSTRLLGGKWRWRAQRSRDERSHQGKGHDLPRQRSAQYKGLANSLEWAEQSRCREDAGCHSVQILSRSASHVLPVDHVGLQYWVVIVAVASCCNRRPVPRR